MEFTFQVATRTPTNLGGFPDSLRAARVGAMDVDARLRELGIELPTPAAPGGNYVPVMRAGDLLFLSGAGPVRPDGGMVTGKVGEGGLALDEARYSPRLSGLELIEVLLFLLGDLRHVR